jgi:hypothetical protein
VSDSSAERYFERIDTCLASRVDAATFSLIYASSLAPFAGSAHFVVTWLIYISGDPLASAWYVSLTGAVGLIARVMMGETAPTRIAARAPTAAPVSRAGSGAADSQSRPLLRWRLAGSPRFLQIVVDVAA